MGVSATLVVRMVPMSMHTRPSSPSDACVLRTGVLVLSESAALPSQLPSQSRGALLPGELWATQGNVRDAVRAAEVGWRGWDPEAPPLLLSMDRGREFFGTRYVMCACVERSLARRGVEPFLVRMEVQSIIRYVASLERDGEEWCAYHFPFMPEDVDPEIRPHLVRLAEQAGM